MVEAAFVRLQQLAGILAAIAVTLANRLGAELRALLWHPGIVHHHNHRRHTDCAACGAHGVIAFTNRQRDPLVPRDGTDERWLDCEMEPSLGVDFPSPASQ